MVNSNPEKGDQIPHEEYYEIAGGTIPFNLTVTDLETGEAKIRCPRCDKESSEEDFDWVDTSVYVEAVSDDGTIINRNVESVTLQCPKCENLFSAY